jgi:uncharacterized protein
LDYEEVVKMAKTFSTEALQIKCPRCGKQTVFSPENPYRPFCSERCRTTDLGAWASESYKVASDEQISLEDSELTDQEKN